MLFADWGKIANPGFDRQRVKGAYFFAGDWRSAYNPVEFYGPPVPSANDCLYTVHPADGQHLGWSVKPENRSFAVSEMLRAGLNTAVMSYWGEPDTDRWRSWAPMQTSTEAHDQLFTEAVTQNLLIMPAIEGGAATANSPAFSFADDFPPANPATCSLTHQITDLVQRYLTSPSDDSWSAQWLTLYDQAGVPRRAIYIIQVWSSQASLVSDAGGNYSAAQHAQFAAGFDAVAEAVFEATQQRVGFVIDALCQPISPAGQPIQYHPVSSYPTCNPDAACALSGQQSLLAVGAFIPENTIIPGHPEAERIDLKGKYLANWKKSGVPTIMDLSVGYDGHLVFQPGPYQPSGIWGNNASWRTELLRMQPDTFTGVTFNTWNGYTEGYAVVPTTEFGESAFRWVQRVTRQWFDILPDPSRNFTGGTVTALWQTSPLYLRLFVTDVVGSVWMTWWEPDREWTFWSVLLPAALQVKMHPGATVTALWADPGMHLDLFATGTDGAVWTIWWDNVVGWRPEGWILLHPETKMHPGATVTALWADPDKHLDLFATGTDGAVWTIWWDNVVGWRPEGWILLHPEVKMQPGATVTALWAPSGKHLDLFVTDASGVVWSTWYDGTGWRPEGWFSIGDSFAIAPGSCVASLWSPDPALNHLDLYSIGRAGQVVSAFWEPDLGW